MGQLRYSAGLLDAICPDRLLHNLHSAVGALAETAGLIAIGAWADEEPGGPRWPKCAASARHWLP
jgi:hypothetical protein